MKRFRVLRSFALLLRILGWVNFIVGLVIFLLILLAPPYLAKLGVAIVPGTNLLAALLVMLLAVFMTICLIASGELIQLFLALEEHTRKVRGLWDRR